jgi:hypothetical protein
MVLVMCGALTTTGETLFLATTFADFDDFETDLTDFLVLGML